MSKEIKVNWRGNVGYANPSPDTIEFLMCGICGEQMNVKRNMYKATSFVESLAGGKHKHDAFICPNIDKDWHNRIYHLKMKVYIAEMKKDPNVGQFKEQTEIEIIKILSFYINTNK